MRNVACTSESRIDACRTCTARAAQRGEDRLGTMAACDASITSTVSFASARSAAWSDGPFADAPLPPPLLGNNSSSSTISSVGAPAEEERDAHHRRSDKSSVRGDHPVPARVTECGPLKGGEGARTRIPKATVFVSRRKSSEGEEPERIEVVHFDDLRTLDHAPQVSNRRPRRISDAAPVTIPNWPPRDRPRVVEARKTNIGKPRMAPRSVSDVHARKSDLPLVLVDDGEVSPFMATSMEERFHSDLNDRFSRPPVRITGKGSAPSRMGTPAPVVWGKFRREGLPAVYRGSFDHDGLGVDTLACYSEDEDPVVPWGELEPADLSSCNTKWLNAADSRNDPCYEHCDDDDDAADIKAEAAVSSRIMGSLRRLNFRRAKDYRADCRGSILNVAPPTLSERFGLLSTAVSRDTCADTVFDSGFESRPKKHANSSAKTRPPSNTSPRWVARPAKTANCRPQQQTPRQGNPSPDQISRHAADAYVGFMVAKKNELDEPVQQKPSKWPLFLRRRRSRHA